MLWAYEQRLDPLAEAFWARRSSPPSSPRCRSWCFYLLVVRRWLAPWAGAAAAVVALLIAVFVYGMPAGQGDHGRSSTGRPSACCRSAGRSSTPCCCTTSPSTTGQFDVVRRSVASLSDDARVQAILIAFAFGAFLEGAAGGGTPVAICGAILVGLGFRPFQAAVLCLIANTSPVAYGGLGTPLIILDGVTEGLPADTLSRHGRPSAAVPVADRAAVHGAVHVYLAADVGGLAGLLVAGGSFAVFQYFFATVHV